jgi:hypothetical protein
MARLCPKCGVDLDKQDHRANCATRRTNNQMPDDAPTINPAVFNDLTTNEIDDDGGGVATLDTPEVGGEGGGSD